MTVPLKKLDIAMHPLFDEFDSNFEEMMKCVSNFLDGESGVFDDEDEVLGFLEKDIQGKLRHGVYETDSAGRVHVVGDSEKIMVMPDIAFANFERDLECNINKCQCSKHKAPAPNPTK